MEAKGGGTRYRAGSHLKEAIERRKKDQYKLSQKNHYKYLDGMQKDLNQEIQDNVFPHWRNHASLKGKQADVFI